MAEFGVLIVVALLVLAVLGILGPIFWLLTATRAGEIRDLNKAILRELRAANKAQGVESGVDRR